MNTKPRVHCHRAVARKDGASVVYTAWKPVPIETVAALLGNADRSFRAILSDGSSAMVTDADTKGMHVAFRHSKTTLCFEGRLVNG